MRGPKSIGMPALLLVAGVLAGCGGSGGGDNNPPPNPPPPPPPPASGPILETANRSSAVIGRDGGSVTATSTAGLVYLLEIPRGALTEETEISLTPVSDMNGAPLDSGMLGAVRFEPNGLAFLRPATLHVVTTPSDDQLELAGFSTADDGTSFGLRPAFRVGNEVVVDVPHFSVGGVSEATAEEIDAEIPLEPLDPGITTLEDFITAVLNLNAQHASAEQIGTVFQRWYQQHVQPDIDAADGSTDPEVLAEAVSSFNQWRTMIDGEINLSFLDAAAFRAELETEEAHAAGRLPAILRALVDGELATCAAEQSLDSVSQASAWQAMAQDLGFDSPDVGLDRPAFLVRVNDCVRVVIDPISLPDPMPLNTSLSLDARAQIVFADDPEPRGGPFEFTVAATDATVTSPTGNSDAEGNYTTVFQATAVTVSFSVRACLVLPQSGVSDICATESTSRGTAAVFKFLRYTLAGRLNDEVIRDDPLIAQRSFQDADFPDRVAEVNFFSDTLTPEGGVIQAEQTCSGVGQEIRWGVQLTVDRPRSVTFDVTYSLTGAEAQADVVSPVVGENETHLDSSNPTVTFTTTRVVQPGSVDSVQLQSSVGCGDAPGSLSTLFTMTVQ